jgi:hypothetical protein
MRVHLAAAIVAFALVCPSMSRASYGQTYPDLPTPEWLVMAQDDLRAIPSEQTGLFFASPAPANVRSPAIAQARLGQAVPEPRSTAGIVLGLGAILALAVRRKDHLGIRIRPWPLRW